MKVFVTGVAGQLGHDVMNELAKRGYEGIGTDIAPEYSGAADGTAVVSMPYVSLDITDADAVDRVICEMKPDVVVHCAAWTAVDLAEDEDKKDKVHAINADGTANIAKACKKTGSKMVYISTDYVFDGQGTTPWTPDCKDYKPLNVYGNCNGRNTESCRISGGRQESGVCTCQTAACRAGADGKNQGRKRLCAYDLDWNGYRQRKLRGLCIGRNAQNDGACRKRKHFRGICIPDTRSCRGRGRSGRAYNKNRRN